MLLASFANSGSSGQVKKKNNFRENNFVFDMFYRGYSVFFHLFLLWGLSINVTAVSDPMICFERLN